jgi:hypothetical protein
MAVSLAQGGEGVGEMWGEGVTSGGASAPPTSAAGARLQWNPHDTRRRSRLRPAMDRDGSPAGGSPLAELAPLLELKEDDVPQQRLARLFEKHLV